VVGDQAHRAGLDLVIDLLGHGAHPSNSERDAASNLGRFMLTGQATQREAAERYGVDRSTVVTACRVAKQTSHGEIVSSGGGVGGVV
jgi:hypothetical protein